MFTLIALLSVFFFLMIRRPPRSTRTDTSFPTRRSSDLTGRAGRHLCRRRDRPAGRSRGQRHSALRRSRKLRRELRFPVEYVGGHAQRHALRSEEHTSELQSLMRISYAVFCLKKKKRITNNDMTTEVVTLSVHNTV